MTKFDKVLARRQRRPDSPSDPIAYQNLSVVKRLSQARFSVYLALSTVNQQHYALKIFPYIGEDPHVNYRNESRFASIKHPHVIGYIHSEKDRDTMHKGKLNRVSYLLMEYAPHGDFFNFIINHRGQTDDKLARTYFRQLVDGIEYLHNHNIAHLDLKPENLLIGSDFNLKIIDFDLSYIHGDPRVLGKGTKYYRAPELSKALMKVPFAADIYSAGVVLFILKSGGVYPHAEENGVDSGHFAEMMYGESEQFWIKHCELEERHPSFYDRSFKELFLGMVRLEPNKRFSLKEIRQSEWYNGPVYSQSELSLKMRQLLGC